MNDGIDRMTHITAATWPARRRSTAPRRAFLRTISAARSAETSQNSPGRPSVIGGVDEARLDGHDPDAVAADPVAQGLEIGVEPGLGGVVDRVGAPAAVTGHRADADDGAPPSLPKRSATGFSQATAPSEVDLEHLAGPWRCRTPRTRPVPDHTGGVDHQVEPAEVAAISLEQLGHLVGIAHVVGKDESPFLARRLVDGGRATRSSSRPAAPRGRPGPVGGQTPGHRLTDARRGADHKGVLELNHPITPPPLYCAMNGGGFPPRPPTRQVWKVWKVWKVWRGWTRARLRLRARSGDARSEIRDPPPTRMPETGCRIPDGPPTHCELQIANCEFHLTARSGGRVARGRWHLGECNRSIGAMGEVKRRKLNVELSTFNF